MEPFHQHQLLRSYWPIASAPGKAVLAALGLAAVGVACSGLSSPDRAATPTRPPVAEAADTTLSLTVYNEGTALVRDRRQFDLADGLNEIAFTDVSASIDPTSPQTLR